MLKITLVLIFLGMIPFLLVPAHAQYQNENLISHTTFTQVSGNNNIFSNGTGTYISGDGIVIVQFDESLLDGTIHFNVNGAADDGKMKTLVERQSHDSKSSESGLLKNTTTSSRR